MASNDTHWNANDTNQVNNDIANSIVEDNTLQSNEIDDDEGKFKIVDYSDALEQASQKQKITLPILTKFERAKLIGVRATQIARGSKPLVNVTGLKEPFDKAEKELNEKMTPLIIRRTLPDGSYEDWKIEGIFILKNCLIFDIL